MKKETEYIIQLIVKRLQGGLSPEEETFFTAWKSRSKANEELYERLEMNMRNIRNILYTNSLMLVGRGRLS